VFYFDPKMNEIHIQKHYFFSWYGLCGDNKIFKPNNINANIGMNIKKKVKLVIILFFCMFEVKTVVNMFI